MLHLDHPMRVDRSEGTFGTSNFHFCRLFPLGCGTGIHTRHRFIVFIVPIREHSLPAIVALRLS